MIKLVYCLRRQAHLSHEQFQRYWWETHGPLVREHAAALAIRRYVQVHTLDGPINDALRAGRGTGEPFDGVAELWWESAQDLAAASASPAGQRAVAALLEDERRFIDFARSVVWVGEERVVIGS